MTLETLLERADQALYASKQSGRNQVSVWNEPGQNPPEETTE
jgi:PleD family two-component response regulator